MQEIPFDQDPWLLLRNRLKELHQEQGWQRWLEELQKQLAQHGQIDSKWIDKLQKKLAEHPELLQQMQEQLQKTQSQGSKDHLGKDEASPDLSQLAQKLRQLVQEPAVQPSDMGEENGPTLWQRLPVPGADEGDFDAWLAARLHELEQSRWGTWLQSSPAFRRALSELRGRADVPLPPHSLPGLEHLPLPARWSLPDLFPKDWPLPRLPALAWHPQITLPHLPVPQWHAPAISLPTGSLSVLGRSGGTFGAWWLIIILVLFLLILFVAKRFWHRFRKRSYSTAPTSSWTFAWDQITSRQELVQAFNHLVLCRLGRAAQSWNHRQAAQQLAALRPQEGVGSRAAHELAEWYAFARYAPAEEPLPPQVLVSARQQLLFFAEAQRS